MMFYIGNTAEHRYSIVINRADFSASINAPKHRKTNRRIHIIAIFLSLILCVILISMLLASGPAEMTNNSNPSVTFFFLRKEGLRTFEKYSHDNSYNTMHFSSAS